LKSQIPNFKFEINVSSINVEPESAGKPDALQTLRDKARQSNNFAQAFGVRPACRRFSFTDI